MKIVCTGAAGFIGSHVVELLAQDNQILALDNLSTGKLENLDLSNKNIEFAKCDITAYYDVVGEMKDFEPDAVIHLAAQSAIMTSIENPIKDAHHNIMGTLAVISACHEVGVKRLVFSSTSAVYDINNPLPLREDCLLNPNTPYGISKLAAETYVHTQMEEGVVLRFANVYGPRQVPIGENQVIPRMIRHLEKGDKFFIFGDGEQKRDFIYVKDVAEATKCALTGKPGIYNVARGSSVSINELASIIQEIYDLYHYPWMHTDVQDPRRDSRMAILWTEHRLKWHAITSMMEGLRETVAWWKTQ